MPQATASQTNMTPVLAAGLDMRQSWGAIVTDVAEKSAAAAAGLAVAYNAGANEGQAFARTVILSGQAAGVTAFLARWSSSASASPAR